MNAVKQIDLRRRVGLQKRPRARLPLHRSPMGIARDYARLLIALVRWTRRETQPIFDKIATIVGEARGVRLDADSKTLKDAIELLRKKMETAFEQTKLEGVASRIVDKVSGFNREQISKQARAALGVDVFTNDEKLRQRAETFVKRNVELITDLPKKVVGDVEKTIQKFVTTGKTHKALAAELEERFDMAEGRAARIARDQTLTLYGQINADRQQELGVTRFIWRTMNDERVRDEHRELEGQVFSYDDLPDEGLPGQPINCRCHAEPVLSDLLEGL